MIIPVEVSSRSGRPFNVIFDFWMTSATTTVTTTATTVTVSIIYIVVDVVILGILIKSGLCRFVFVCC